MLVARQKSDYKCGLRFQLLHFPKVHLGFWFGPVSSVYIGIVLFELKWSRRLKSFTFCFQWLNVANINHLIMVFKWHLWDVVKTLHFVDCWGSHHWPTREWDLQNGKTELGTATSWTSDPRESLFAPKVSQTFRKRVCAAVVRVDGYMLSNIFYSPLFI